MTSDKTLKQAISNITIWRKGEQRAPHKPLLLLYVLSHYRQGHDRHLIMLLKFMSNCWIYWSAMPQRREQRPDMPFWRLKGDGFWELQNAEFCSTSGSRQPPKRELIEYNVAGGFDAVNFALVTKKRKLIDTLAQQILRRIFRPVFRKTSLTRWVLIFAPLSVNAIRSSAGGATSLQLSMCGLRLQYAPRQRPIALEAAHIRWKQHHGPCEVPNGRRCAQSIIKRSIVVRLAG